MPDTTYVPTARLGPTLGLRDGPPTNAPLERDDADARAFLRELAATLLVGAEHLLVEGTAAAPVVHVGAVEAVTLRAPGDSGSGGAGSARVFGLNAHTLGGGAFEGGLPLAPDTRYHLYAWVDGAGVVAVQASSVPPTTAAAPLVLRAWRRGYVANHRYLGCFFTDSAGNPVASVKHGRRTTFRVGAGLPVQVVAPYSNAAAWTAVSLAARLPPWSRAATLRVLVRRDAASPGVRGEVRAQGDAGIALAAVAPYVAGVVTEAETQGVVALGEAQMVEFQCVAAPAVTYGLAAWLAAFEE